MASPALPSDVLDAALAIASRAAQQAGQIIKTSIESRLYNRVPATTAPAVAAMTESTMVGLAIETKSETTDLVTQYDKECERLIFAELHAFRPPGQPEFLLMGEETASDMQALTDAPTWIVDPIDGTTSFVHGNYDCCVSIGLAVNKVSVLGVVFAPMTNEFFTAVAGRGAFCNGRRIAASTVKDTTKAFIITHAPYDRREQVIQALQAMNTIFLTELKVHCLRAHGSAALDMCNVAIGRADCYIEVGICAWDVCAGAVIVREAGGQVTDVYGGPLDLTRRGQCCAGTKEIHDIAVSVAKRVHYREAMLGSA